jgi:hypothetical protein
MPRAKKQSGTDSQYKSFLENLDLFAVGLESISAKLDRAAYSKVERERPRDLVYEIRNHFGLSEFDEGHFDVAATFAFEAKLRGREPVLTVEATFSAHFHPTGDSVPKDFAEKFAEAEARLVFWPYFRQAVADLTSRMYIRQVTIPLTLKP